MTTDVLRLPAGEPAGAARSLVAAHSERLEGQAAVFVVDDDGRHATYGLVVVAAVAIVLVPGALLVGILFLSQALNAVLLLPLLLFIRGLASDDELMGRHALGGLGRLTTAVAIALLGTCVGALLVLSL